MARQKDAQYSGLHWYSSFFEALSVAKKENKPILSLRLLGNLTDELSCANSRFFRTTLYPDPRVREELSKHFVLHWQSVRPVPVITIDFGDGRQLRQTITGNSLHMILDSNGRPTDVLPGLYGAREFVRQIERARLNAEHLASVSNDQFQRELIAVHETLAQEAAEILQGHQDKLPGVRITPLPNSEEDWGVLASLYESDSTPAGMAAIAVSDKGGRPPVKRAMPDAARAGELAVNKSYNEAPLFAGMKRLSEAIALDTVKNEFRLRPMIREHLKMLPTLDRDELVSYVYANVFFSPLDDPWYGLSQPDIYAALPGNGRVRGNQ